MRNSKGGFHQRHHWLIVPISQNLTDNSDCFSLLHLLCYSNISGFSVVLLTPHGPILGRISTKSVNQCHVLSKHCFSSNVAGRQGTNRAMDGSSVEHDVILQPIAGHQVQVFFYVIKCNDSNGLRIISLH